MREIKKLIAILIFSFTILGITSDNKLNAEEVYQSNIIEGGTIYNETIPSAATYSLDYSVEPTNERTSIAPVSNNTPIEGQSMYVDTVKSDTDAGEYYILFNNENATIEYNQNGIINSNSSVTASTTNENEYFVIENGLITEASSANFMTIGGSEYTAYMYQSLEDASSGTNGVPISGNAQDGHYYGTTTYANKKYAEIEISGFHGYINLYDIQIVPSYFEMNTSFYFAKDGIWYYAIATDPLKEASYEIWPISDAPAWAQENTKYYSSDQTNFTTNEYMHPSTYVDYQNSSYFQNLSFRSTTTYSGTQLQNFLAHKGYTNSEYYNSTSAFVDKQEYFGINGLLLFAHANLESTYGTSHYAQECNNFFGRGAFDSNPDNACISYGYPTAKDGIYAEAIFYNNNYLDPGYYSMDKGYSYYEGSYVGNKSGGMNVHYATDPNWGSKIGSIAYECDSYLGGKDNNKYKVIEITSEQYIYSDSALTNHVYVQGDYTYYPSSTDHDNAGYYGFTQPDVGNPHVVVVGETSNAYKVQVEAPVNKGASGFETFTTAEKGSYPNYNEVLGGSTNYVKSGYANFANEYESMTAQQFWIPKSSSTVVIANNPITNTSTTPYYANCSETISTKYDANGNKVVEKKASDNSKYCTLTYQGSNGPLITQEVENYYNSNKMEYLKYQYNPDGTVTQREWYKYDSNGVKISYEKMMYKNGKYSSSSGNFYKSDGSIYQKFQKYYETDGSLYLTYNYYYDSSNNLYRKEIYKYHSDGKKYYYCDAYYYPNGGKIKNSYEYFYDSKGKRIQRNELSYETDGSLYLYQKYYYTSSNILYNKETYKYTSSGRKTYFCENNYNSSSGIAINYFEYYYDVNGKRIQRNERYYDSNGQGGIKYYYYYNSNNVLIDSEVDYY